jgi:DHA1 family bicyclomycin/chloramphenicol resistance-like MFS transporter
VRGRDLRITVVLGALTAFGPVSIDLYLPALPELARDFGTHESQVQLTITTCLIGLAVGQALAGPVSDALGRRRPLLIGVAVYAAASVACAVSASLGLLTAMRLLQGFAGAAGIVIARAVVRDLYSGTAAARYFSLLMLVTGLAPILAPFVGAQLLHLTSWRGLFAVLAAYGVLLAAGVALFLRETLPAGRRVTGGVRQTGRAFRMLATDRDVIGYSLACGFMFAAMFAYIAGSPFVLQNVYGLSPAMFGVAFGVNSIGIVTASQVGRRLLLRLPERQILGATLAFAATAGLALVAASAIDLGLAGVLVPLFCVISCVGLVFPTATSLALANHPEVAGTASGLLGVLQFLLGAATAPLVGLAGTDTALPMASVIATLALAALLAFRVMTSPARAAVS